MAERFPRYRPLGAQIAPLGNVRYSQAGQARAGAMREASRALNAMTEFALQEYSEDVLEHSVSKAPDAKQIKDALDNPEVLAAPVDTGIGRNIWAQVIYSRLQSAAATEINVFENDPENVDLDAGAYGQKIQGIVNGYVDVMKGIDPAMAVKFSASMNATGNTSVRSHLANAVKRQEEMDRAQDFADVERMTKEVVSIVNAGPTVDSQGNTITTKQYFDNMASELWNKTHMTASEKKAGHQRLRDTFVTSIAAKVTNWVMEDPIKHLAQFQAGEFDEPWLTIDMGTMEPNEVLAIRQSVQSAVKDALSTEASIESQIASNRQEQSREIQAQLAAVFGQPDLEAPLMERLRIVDPDAWTSRTEAMASSGGRDVAEVVSSLDRGLIENTLTYEEVYKQQTAGHITTDTARRLYNGISAGRNKKFGVAMDLAKARLGYPDRPLINPTSADRRAEQQVANIRGDLILAAEENPAIDHMQFVKDALKTIKSEEEQERISNLKSYIDETIVTTPVFNFKKNDDGTYDMVALKAAINSAAKAGRFDRSMADAYIKTINDYLGSK